jgi:hypothetical protein
MSKHAFFHRKPRISLITALALLFVVVSVSFGTIIYSADSETTGKGREEKSVINKSGLKSILNNVLLSKYTENPERTLTVNRVSDSNDISPGDGICMDSAGGCSLRAAIQEANASGGNDVIEFVIATPATIQLNPDLTPGELTITDGVTINGPGARLLTVSGVTNPSARSAENPEVTTGIFNITTTTSVNTTIKGLTLSNSEGRGINNTGRLNLSDVAITGHHYGIYNSGRLSVNRALIHSNSSGGIYLASSSTQVNISNTTITNNNSSSSGAGIYSLASDLTLNNVTISHNSAAVSGGGLYYENANPGVFTRNTIIAVNNSTAGPDIFAANASSGAIFTSRGNNLIGKSAPGLGFADGTNGDKVGTLSAPKDPLLGNLKNNGGETNTRALQNGSPARDAGNNCVINGGCTPNPPVSPLTSDQRGGDFPRSFGDGVDIGAFESYYPRPSIDSINPDNWGTGSGAVEITINGSNFVADSIIRWNSQDKTPVFVSNNQLRLQLAAADVAETAQYNITVVNPEPGGGSSETITFSVADCTYSLNPTENLISAAGGSSTIAVTTRNGCAWTAVSNNSWITITSGATGRGDGTIAYNVAPNNGAPREGTITAGGQTFTVRQSGNCTFTLSPTSKTAAAGGDTGSFTITASSSNCTWTATPSASWITINGAASGTGNGTVQFNVAPNTGALRTGTITVGEQVFTITQQSGCDFTLSPTSTDVPASGATSRSFTVSTAAGCSWSATTTDNWISITSGSGSGNGTVQFNVAPNTGAARTGKITVGGKEFTVNQAGSCVVSLSSNSLQVSASGISGASFNVTINAGCQWTAVSSQSWATITSGASGTGSGTVVFSVTPNTGPERTATITVNDQIFTITQANGCIYNLVPSSQNFQNSGGTGFFDISTGAGCQWSAVVNPANSSWVSITSGGGSRTGSGRVNFSVAANNGPPRTGTITAGGQTFTITQENGCTFTLSPTGSPILAAAGASSSFSVTPSNSACTWTATANDSWITITSGASGTGNGTVQFTVTANTGPRRTGTITAGGQTFTVTQETGCTFTLTPDRTNFGAGGGSGSFNITTNNPACQWTAATAAPWITILAPTTGTGNGVVSFTVQPNISPARTGTITAGGQTFTITQENGCTYTLSEPGRSVPAAAGSYTFNVNTGAGCQWSAAVSSNTPWLTITSGASGTGTGTVTFSVAENTGPQRIGTITAQGQTYTVTQLNGCRIALVPTETTVPSSGTPSGSFSVTTAAGCTWTVQSNVSWIIINSGASGGGNGTVQFTVQANISPQRQGTITVTGVNNQAVFTVTQENGCTYAISPEATSVDEAGGNRIFNVVAGPGCTWSAASNNTWITITGGASGSGNGTVTLSIAASSGEERTGTVTAAGRTFTVSQISLRVTNYNDNGPGSLRRAVFNANNTPTDDVITIDNNLFGNITLTSGEIQIVSNGKLEIRGPGADRLKISGNNNSRIFFINSGVVTISGVTIRDGNGVGIGSDQTNKIGGAIYVIAGSLTLDRVEVFNNTISFPDGQFGANSKGCGIFYNQGNHVIQNSTLLFNRCDFGGGYFKQSGSVNVINSTIYGNTANKEGGAIFTISGNDLLRNVTISRNTAAANQGGGILNFGSRVNLHNSIIAENTGAEITLEEGQYLSQGNNLIGDAPGDANNTKNPVVYLASDIKDTQPMLSVTGLFGGGTRTAALLPESPARDRGSSDNISAADQRGAPRTINGAPDIGAYEYSITISPATLPSGQLGAFYDQKLSAARIGDNNPFIAFEYGLADGFLPTGFLPISRDGGIISGTPTVPGEYTFMVMATAASDKMAGVRKFTIFIGCSYAINPQNQSFGVDGGTGTINVSATAGCGWNAQSGAPWITVTGGANGNGNGAVNYSVAPNTGAARSGVIPIANQTFTINQSACGFSLSSNSASVPAGGGSGSFALTTSNSCQWTTQSDASWLTVTNGATGSGNRTIQFSAAANTGAARQGKISVGGLEFTVSQEAGSGSRARFEFDGDGKSDLAVFRPSNGVWHILGSQNGYTGIQFGITIDKPVAADYDGDGKTDIAVYREGIWHLLKSRDGYTGIQFGLAGDFPQPGDFDGDGLADLAVFRPSNGVWYVLASRDGFSAVQFGITTDKPVAADYDGDGKTDVAVYRNGIWHILRSRDGYTGLQFGIAADIPTAADYDGDGKTDVAVYREGIWHILGSRDGYTGIQFGIATDKPVPADYNGDGKTDIAVYRDGIWHIFQSGSGESSGYRAVQFGESTDIPIPASLQ